MKLSQTAGRFYLNWKDENGKRHRTYAPAGMNYSDAQRYIASHRTATQPQELAQSDLLKRTLDLLIR